MIGTEDTRQHPMVGARTGDAGVVVGVVIPAVMTDKTALAATIMLGGVAEDRRQACGEKSSLAKDREIRRARRHRRHEND